ncbi:similar to Saccharomyces cerevisiae YBR123C TFC1 One of six subunits of the RNA polymerase III transcription initiation factor complex (TFIIIC) [Maudiozyma barnettii]|uniref:Similar to Saccharomyces cerevisiae YBR123C TFC1 One of six subunits of the RNA polymerase III transcription initiation factor complex (TFIIIC) n=1 Tax=Maudiozyma barnettii TaxID=61262 RepID=A0A8H2ZH97_9SACH|nr:transcription factor TFIIIC subunit TFC1 [Kazachstania barnettii]CAB4251919.1 similar to Saccharomyces cerevisiae YBR123C TFC1 One of six subunits of the RNA polymerase III transcription initiation factor complex (TFIIIC) [Kazachstania barnettii]CAD1778259.1 similar to Saccharomyces cerevisiae YBR123C TFC1 One of six subunits of the RNA polymerase III transcription initiation factor complex (TFIIIC) [Kazachstania barnettii]
MTSKEISTEHPLPKSIHINFLDQSSDDPNQTNSNILAKEYTLDIPRIPSVELPLCVSGRPESIAKAVSMCGGINKIKDMLKKSTDPEVENYLELYLNDKDNKNDGGSSFFNEHPIIGKPVPYRDSSVVLKIVMPKGTMKKHEGNVQKSLASLHSNDYKITPVAVVDNTIKFREMSDFQYCLDNVPAANEYVQSFGSLEWQNIKQLVDSVPVNDTKPQENISNLIFNRGLKSPSSDYQLIPPPRLSMIGFPHLYKYRKNPLAVKKADGVSEVKGSYIKNYQLFLHTLGDNVKVPIEPHNNLQHDYKIAKETKIYPGTKQSSKFYESLEECLSILGHLFEKRPIWIKRHLDGIIPKRIHHTLKIALALITYRFTMGPWRNTYIKFGCDPRLSKVYAKYQTEYFKIERKLLSSPTVRKNIPKLSESVFESNVPGDIDTRFRFDGKQIPWYLMLQIDMLICEPNVAEVYDKVQYLDTPNEITGWFSELDLVKIRRIVKYELGCLAQGNLDFNKYKLKYFKTMQYVKESLINEKDIKESQAVDGDGDIDMDRESNENNTNDKEFKDITESIIDEDEDDDNGIIAGEVDEDALDVDESDSNENILIADAMEDEMTESKEDFDLASANFQDVVARIMESDPVTAKRLQLELEGFVNINKI